MKNLFITLLLIVSLGIMTACTVPSDPDPDDNLPDPTKPIAFETSHDLLGFSVVSTVTALSYTQTTLTSSAFFDEPVLLSHTLFNEPLNADFAILDEIDDLEPYLALINTFMGQGVGMMVTVSENTTGDYDYTMTIMTTDLTGDHLYYTFLFNETIEEDSDPTEYESIIEGIMVVGSVTYQLYGERDVSPDEESLSLTATIDEENYVTLYYDIEIDDDGYHSTTFEYELYINDELFKSIIIEFEQDESEIEMSLEFIEGDHESTYDFSIEYDDNELIIKIEYTISAFGDDIEEGDIEITVWFDAANKVFYIKYEITIEGEEEIIIEREYTKHN